MKTTERTPKKLNLSKTTLKQLTSTSGGSGELWPSGTCLCNPPTYTENPVQCLGTVDYLCPKNHCETLLRVRRRRHRR